MAICHPFLIYNSMSVKQIGGRIIVISTEEGDFVSSLARTKVDGTRQLKFSGDMDLETNKIVNLTDPTANQEAATKAYVDTNGGGSPGGSSTHVQYNNAGSFGGGAGFVFDGSGNVTATDSVEIDRIGIGGQNPNEIRTNNNISLQNMAIDPVNNNGFVINSTEHFNPTVTEDFLFVHGTDAEPLGEGRVGQHLTSSGNLGKSVNVYQTLYLTYQNRQRSDDATAEIYPGGNYNSFELPTDGNSLFEYLIVGTTDDGTNQKRNAYRYNGLIKNNDGTGSFVGTPTKTAIASGSPDLDVTLSLASNTPSAGDVSVILKGIHGSNSTTHWCAKMTAVEVRGEASGAPIPFHGGNWSTVGSGILGG